MKPADKKQVRTFGWGVTGLFTFFGILKLIFGEQPGIPWQFYVAAAFALLNLTLPVVIYPLYRAAIFIARYLGWFNTRLILGLMYFLVFTPLAIVFKIIGKDPLDRKFDPNAESYWQKREQIEFDPKSVENQF